MLLLKALTQDFKFGADLSDADPWEKPAEQFELALTAIGEFCTGPLRRDWYPKVGWDATL
jgi:hypothetical protein